MGWGCRPIVSRPDALDPEEIRLMAEGLSLVGDSPRVVGVVGEGTPCRPHPRCRPAPARPRPAVGEEPISGMVTPPAGGPTGTSGRPGPGTARPGDRPRPCGEVGTGPTRR